MLLLCIVKFGPTAQIFAKTPKFETPFSLFSRTHARGLLMAHSTRFFPPICNRVNEASLRSPDNNQLTILTPLRISIVHNIAIVAQPNTRSTAIQL